ncbi:MAG TPA: S9 family peptidase [Gemmatimonadales bacterium]|nr:S9 family peptidase [Gemmatimonadales bacterium]
MRRSPLHLAVLALLLPAAPAAARQQPQGPADSALLTVDRIYGGTEFATQPFGPARWLPGGTAYTTLERAQGGRGREIVRYDAETGAREVLVTASQLTPAGDSVPLTIENYAWTSDLSRLLIFTNSQPVWRTNDRGDYWVLDRNTGRLRKLGGAAARPSTLMFAKFSPDGRRVGYVREHNLYVEDLSTGRIIQLTRDGSRTRVNGSFDWVYEEEFGLHDGWRWSPDGRAIAYWQLDITGVRDFAMINTTDSLYSFVNPVQYPKAGETNSAWRIGVVSAAGGLTRWMRIEGDPRNTYAARMEWVPPAAGAPASQIVIQHLNRLQNTLSVMVADVRTGAARTLFVEQDLRAWVEVFDHLTFLNGGRDVLWMSDRSGWDQLWLMPAAGGEARPVTRGEFDVLGVLGVDEADGWVYFIASPDNPTQRYLFRARLDGSGTMERLSPAMPAGSNSYNVAPGFRFAFHTFSSFGNPPRMSLVRLPSHQPVRELTSNDQLRSRVARLRLGTHRFFQVDVGGGVRLHGWEIRPPDFDSTRRYPVLFYVYGGPGSQTVLDSWGGATWLWHNLLAQQGVIVMSIDNRGTGARGREWRKIIYGQMGVVETQDQAAAARVIGRWSYVDSTRMGIWGWSYGGFMTLNALTQFPEVYRMGIAVAPVTHWKYYDTIYTERYNGLPQDNMAGYDRGSPLTYASNLRARLLIVHGTGDDNVHYQNTEAMVNALVAANRPFELMVYPNRNHGIFGGNTTRHLRTLLTRFVLESVR